MRGRDIKRYSYEFADLYLIATLPSLKIKIDEYPAVKQHLLSFGYDRLKQTGDLGARKKTNYQWFETQDSISYWEDFSKQKIVFQEMVQESSFILDKSGHYLCLDTARIITGNDLEILICILNSKLFFFAIKMFYGGGGLGESGVRMKHTFFENFPMPNFNIEENSLLKNLSTDPLSHIDDIDRVIIKKYKLTEEEIEVIMN